MLNNKMKFTITTNSVVNFKRKMLVHLFGVIELHSVDLLSDQDIWDTIRLYYPRCGIANFEVDDELDYMFGLISELGVVKSDYHSIYQESLEQVRSVIKKQICQCPPFERDRRQVVDWHITAKICEPD
jgi:hypothetical protein